MNAQGEDVVAGTRTPLPISELERENPKIYGQLMKVRRTLERHYRDMMDIEFTIQQGTLYMLQCRVGKRTATAAVRIAVEMVDEKLISSKEALLRVDPERLNELLRPVFDQAAKVQADRDGRLLAKGLNAGPGAATGVIAFHAEDAEELAGAGKRVILVRNETSPEDIRGMAAAEGILTARGGMTSHAALVGRQMGKVCVVGCDALEIDYEAGTMRVAGRDDVLRQGDPISIDGFTGQVFRGEIPTRPSEVVEVLVGRTIEPKQAPTYRLYARLMEWADKVRKLGVRANADLPEQCEQAVAFGAEGVGLCRTEHMFFGEGKIGPMREMILAQTVEERRAALAKLLPLQRADFRGIFEVLAGKPVHHPDDRPAAARVPAARRGGPGRAGGRDGHPGRARARARRGAARVQPHAGLPRLPPRHRLSRDHRDAGARHLRGRRRREGARSATSHPEVMIPLVGPREGAARSRPTSCARSPATVMKERGVTFPYLVGTMIEVPRGALTADDIAGVAEFFSFGTNDLTQTTLGVSRDDAARFLTPYVQDYEIYAARPVRVDRPRRRRAR